MSDLIDNKTPGWYYFVAGFFLFFNIVGLILYYAQVTQTPEQIAMLGPEKAAFMNATPVWANAAYGTAVTAGVIASILLLMRRRQAFVVYAISFAGVLIQDLDSFVLRNVTEVFAGNPMLYIIPPTVLIIGLLELWFSRSVADRYYR